ncbi:hypothetical protein ACSAZL_13100 [Methanosarcina sp. T3]
MSEAERSEKDSVLQSRNSAGATLLKRKAGCCTCSATPMKSPISCDPES